MSKRISRQTFLKGAAAIAVGAAFGKLLWDNAGGMRKLPPCRVLGPSMTAGHALRDGEYASRLLSSKPAELVTAQVTIIGGGIAGLSAAWWLKKHGVGDFQLLELEKHVGGNSASSSNEVSAYPWGAHYVPLPNEESKYVHELFEELGIIVARGDDDLPKYNDLFLCHDPQERLYKDGSFQEGLVPQRGLQERDKEQIAKFFELVKNYRAAKGSDGKPAFAIPLELSSADLTFRRLDQISMSQWLSEQGFDSKPLLWYVNYCCRDDYGSDGATTSAWAGIHYFAGRRGHAQNAEHNSVLTWPEGNGFLVNRLRERLGENIRTGLMVLKVRDAGERCEVLAVNPDDGIVRKFDSRHVIVCCPRFVAHRIVEGADSLGLDMSQVTYAPWMVANVTLNKMPQARGVGTAWDNVEYGSPSLGYVVATHQGITTRPGKTVITYYRPLAEEPPAMARRKLMQTDANRWGRMIIEDLESMHPEIAELIESIDVWPWGHGMIRPTVDYIWGDTRKKMTRNEGRVLYAHSDMSGISNFEEAQYRGVEAAKVVLSQREAHKA